MNYTDNDLLNLYSDPEFYDIEFAFRNQEIPFYKKIVKEISGVILEVACGTGRITLELAKVSSNIIFGSDLSPEMINKAKENARTLNLKNVEFRVEDFRAVNGSYDLIFCATNAFQHLLSTEDALNFLKSTYNSLNQGAYLVFDIQNPDLKKLGSDLGKLHKYKEFVMHGEIIEAHISGEYDSIAQIYFFSIIYLKSGNEIYRKKVAMRMFFPQEIQTLIKICGFTILKIYGGFNEEPLNSDSSKQIYVLKKL